MSLGDVIIFSGGSYEISAIVDERYVVRICDPEGNTKSYEVWTSDEREQFDLEQEHRRLRQDRRRDLDDRNRQIYERNLAGETYASLGREFNIVPSRVSQICAKQARRERTPMRPYEPALRPTIEKRFSTTSEEWEQAKPSPNPVLLLRPR